MKLYITFITICFAFFPFRTSAEQVRFATLDWPPFIGQDLKDHGLYAFIAREAYKVMGHELILEFYPWARAVKIGQSDPKFAGFFPKYYDKNLENNFLFSDSIGNSVVGFVELKSKPIKWNKLQDLKPYRIGTVIGYFNTNQIDRMFSNGELNGKPVVSDILNLKKLLSKRLDMAIIDKTVLEYLLHTDKELSKFKDQFQFNSKPLENKEVFLCFKKTTDGRRWHKIFNEGLKKINIEKVTQDYTNSFKN